MDDIGDIPEALSGAHTHIVMVTKSASPLSSPSTSVMDTSRVERR